MSSSRPPQAVSGARASRVLVAVTTSFILAVPAQALAQPVTPAEVEQMRAELAALKARVATLEARLSEPAPIPAPGRPLPTARSPAVLTLPPRPGADHIAAGQAPPARPPAAWRAPGSRTDVQILGYVQLGAYKNLVGNIDTRKFRVGDIRPRGDPQRRLTGDVQAQLRSSRIGFETITPTRLGKLHTVFALDFAGSEPKPDAQEALQNNGFHLRMTHVYASLGPFPLGGLASEILVGQTFSNFIDDPDTPETIDAAGPASVPAEHQPQIRYTVVLGEQAFSVSLENPMGDYQGPGTSTRSDFDNTSTTNLAPDVTAKYEAAGAWGHAQLSALARWFQVSDGRGHQASAQGFGVIAGATLRLAADERLGGEIWYGRGIGKYIPDDFGTPNGFAVRGFGTPQVQAATQDSSGAMLWLRHDWSPDWRSTLALSLATETYAGFVTPAPDQAPALLTSHLNLIYQPLSRVDFGAELEYGRKAFRKQLHLPQADALRLGVGSRIMFN
ncbi:MAG: porin [Alphaproteobacteria bacterium]|nr:porin [Alphaproteobacteria bacterium]